MNMKPLPLLLLLLLPAGTVFAQESICTVTFQGGATYQCEIADDFIERAIGLKNHAELPAGTGMIFIYQPPSRTSFWMPPSMKFPLDIVFLDDQKRIVHLVENAAPCTDPRGLDCPGFSPEFAVSFVVEIPAGEIEKHAFEIGQQVSFVVP